MSVRPPPPPGGGPTLSPAARAALSHRIKSWSAEEGFELAGIAPASRAPTAAPFQAWLRAGYAGEMAYMEANPNRREEPAEVWSPARSVLVVGTTYLRASGAAGAAGDPPRGRVARYALGDDYHDVLAARLGQVLARICSEVPGAAGRAYVDTGPLLERDLAARAGLGWFGKNTMLLNRSLGSYFFLGALLLNLDLPADEPASAHCGRCTRCLDACPTGAFISPYVLDARRCISYLTIELKGPIPRELRPLMGDWVFGCDICQEVCPWNRKAIAADGTAFAPRPGWSAPELIPLLSLTPAAFSEQFRGTPVKRARRRGLLRNVCVALGNLQDPRAVGPLALALSHDEPLVRGHAAWALGRFPTAPARQALQGSLARETDPWVREEIELALAV